MIPPDASAALVLATVQRAQLTHSLSDLICHTCERDLAVITRHRQAIRLLRRHRQRILDGTHYCRWCARALTADAAAEQPLEGFCRFLRAVAPDRQPGCVT